LTWDNAALVSPATAKRLGLQSEDLVVLNVGGRQVRAPLWVLPGHADDSVTVHLGYGRERVGRVGRRTGFNAYAVRHSAARWIAPGLRIEATGKRYPLASTQDHGSMEGRPLARHATLSHYLQHPDFAKEMEEDPPEGLTMNPPVKYEGHAWAMAIDLNACTGCNACTIACQAENNIPVVGKDQVKVNREMHWIRVDRYFEGEPDAPAVIHQPVPCMHCEDAPCEQVCPVAATVHSSEGLNDMVYNRCVGTKYCANNCPYKVRRFNFFQYSDYTSPTARLLFNPNVTVRTRGVMEKCTYCVQRINMVRNEAEVEGRPIRDGEILTACQQVCPSDAIVFG
ncbi:MAG: 4Fe-4S dicluster domain-containing protein, partial [Acidobacteria bacterium]|nr:4Fe-4S dicluster domain-containing protein [Acidobacteriota bacterium]